MSPRPGVFRRAPRMAGAGGFEPPDARSKVSCLTAWPRPTNRTGFPSRSVRSHQRDPGVMATGLEETAMEKCSGRLARGNGEVKLRGTRRGRIQSAWTPFSRGWAGRLGRRQRPAGRPRSGCRASGAPAPRTRAIFRRGEAGNRSVEFLRVSIHRFRYVRRVGQFPLVLRHHLLRQVLPSRVVDGVREVLMLTVGTLAARHRHEQSGVALDDLEPADDERVVQRDADERLELVVVSQRHPYLGDLDRIHDRVTSEPTVWESLPSPPRGKASMQRL